MPIEDYTQAVRLLHANGHGKVETVDGTVVSGLPFDIESPMNDPERRGYITLQEADGNIADIYEDEFAALLEAW